jgi:ureidoglycolate dehydrogenase (NAD+)
MATASHSSIVISTDALRDLGLAILIKRNVPESDASITIDSLVEADLRGVASHGMQRLCWYAQRLQNGGTNARPDVRVLTETPGTALVDGDHGLGQVVSHRAMKIAIAKAHTAGIGVVSVRNSHHFGACAYWAEMALPHDMIGLTTTNGGALMAPWGGMTPSLSNDPLGVAIPAGKELPIVLDMATSVAAGGKLDVAAGQGDKIPFGWALNARGEPTSDPIAGRQGVLLPIAGPKGYGLTVVFEVLAALLSAAKFARGVPHPSDSSTPMDVGHYFQAVSIGAFTSVDAFKARVDELIQQMKSSQLAPGVEHIYLPGEIEFETRARFLQMGIPMPVAVLDELKRLAQAPGECNARHRMHTHVRRSATTKRRGK